MYFSYTGVYGVVLQRVVRVVILIPLFSPPVRNVSYNCGTTPDEGKGHTRYFDSKTIFWTALCRRSVTSTV